MTRLKLHRTKKCRAGLGMAAGVTCSGGTGYGVTQRSLTPGRVPARSRAGTGDGLHQSQCLLPSLTPGGGTLVLVLLGSSARELEQGLGGREELGGATPKVLGELSGRWSFPWISTPPSRLSDMNQLYPEYSVSIRLIRGEG